MKIVMTGSLGNISRPLSTNLAAKGHEVTVITSDKNKAEAISNIGAKAATGSITDEGFLKQIFTGADVVYLMVPTEFTSPDIKGDIKAIGAGYARAVKASGIKKVVLLSSIGAHLEAGTGPITGLHTVEEALKALDNIDLLILRPGYFYNNFYGNMDMIKHAGIIGANYGANQPIVMVDPQDIADTAAAHIEAGFTGTSIVYIASDRRTLAEVAAALGNAIDKPELPWVEFSDEQAYEGMTTAGMPEDISRNYVEMGTAIRSGILWEDFDAKKMAPAGKVKLEDFAAKFAAAYKG